MQLDVSGWWSDVFGWEPIGGSKCRLGYVIGLASSSLSAPCHISQWTSEFTRELAGRNSGGEVFALSETADHLLLSEDVSGPLLA